MADCNIRQVKKKRISSILFFAPLLCLCYLLLFGKLGAFCSAPPFLPPATWGKTISEGDGGGFKVMQNRSFSTSSSVAHLWRDQIMLTQSRPQTGRGAFEEVFGGNFFARNKLWWCLLKLVCVEEKRWEMHLLKSRFVDVHSGGRGDLLDSNSSRG